MGLGFEGCIGVHQRVMVTKCFFFPSSVRFQDEISMDDTYETRQ